MSSVEATNAFAAARGLVVEGAISDLQDLKLELVRELPSDTIIVGDITEKRTDVFEYDKFGASPVGEILIEIIANVGSAAIVSIASAIIQRVLKRSRLRIKSADAKLKTNGSE